jgi:serine/threonine-protein kinase RsbW/stage II sporulation protein AB (anti-sigma F factor)
VNHTLIEQQMDVRLPAEPASVSAIRHAVRDFAEAHDVPRLPDVILAVNEAVTNAVIHAYREITPGDIHVVARAEPDCLIVVVRDYGAGMRPRPDSPGMGLGLPTIAQLALNFKVEVPEGNGTALRMHFAR